jgi:hypothetical protein
MPGDYMLLNDGQLAIEYWEGNISYDMFMKNEHAISSDPNIKQGSLYLVDLRKAIADVTMEQVREIADVTFHSEYGIRYKKAALVCTENVTFSKSQMYELSVSRQGLSIITFTSLSIACQWLNVDLDQVETAIGKLQHQIHHPMLHKQDQASEIKML